MRSMTQGISTTSSDTDNGMATTLLAKFLCMTLSSFARRVTPLRAGVPLEAHVELIRGVKCLWETMIQTQSILEAVQTRLQAL